MTLAPETCFISFVANLDAKHISKYAKDFPDREDISETINWWLLSDVSRIEFQNLIMRKY